MTFADRYGSWALIAGASEGIGAAFARALYARGLNVVLIGRRAPVLAEFAATFDDPARVETVAADLATAEGLAAVFEATRDKETGLVVANAALSPIGSFLTAEEAELTRALDLNARTPMLLARHYLPAMAARRQGGFIVMSSLAGQQGSPGLAAYAGTKAFGAVLAESLWAELRPSNVDVLVCVAGAVATPGLAENSAKKAPGTVSPETVVAAALKALGKRPRTVPGGLMRFSSVLMSRVLPRRTAITIMGSASKDVLGQ
jgi:uncharacterized protein